MRTGLAVIVFLSLLCHAPGAWGDLSRPGLETRPRVERAVCLTCHDSKMMKPAYRKIVPEWRQSIHYRNGIGCNNCHGGDPNNAALAMSPQKGFVGVPTYQGVPEFCGKCHIDIMKSCCASGHCLALKTTGKGPNCVTCHGAHEVKKASIDLINPSLCGRCHSYARAKTMKAALWQTEMKIEAIDKNLKILKAGLISTPEEDKALFRTQEKYRSLFHTVDVNLVKEKTASFNQKLDAIQVRVQEGFQVLRFRRNFSILLILLFLGLAISIFLFTRRSP
jgi:hypothetical protein